MKKQRWNNLRPIAIAVTLAFGAEQAAFAAPVVSTIVPASLKPQINFSLPQSVAVVDDAYKAPGDTKLLILIQDAHTNDSGQMNVAKALSEILPKEKIDTVFTEADSGDVSLNYLKPFFTQAVREKVGRQLVRKGELRGHDYANLTGSDFRLIGVEDPALYRETLETYRDLTLKRDKVRAYVDRVQRSAEALKASLFSDTLKMLDAKRVANAKGDLTLADYADTLLKESARAGLNAARYPHIKFLRRLRTIEKRVDFKKASAEERLALKSLPFEDRKVLLTAHKNAKSGAVEESGFYTLFEEKLRNAGTLNQFKDLARYFDYLKETRKMNALGVVGEVKGLEEELFLSLAQNRDEAVLWMFSRNLETLQNLINLKVSPEEFRAVRTQGPLYDIKLIAGFLNRKIADLKLHYENALTLEDGYGAAWTDAVKFYELTLERDRVYLERVRTMMVDRNIDKAVLITGGYHTPNLKALLKAEGYSYIALLPQVLHETDAERYERLLLAQLKGSAPSGARIAAGGRPARQEAAMAQQVSPARLAEALMAEGPSAPVSVEAVLAAKPRAAESRVSAARMADYVLDQDRRQVLTSKMSMALIAISEVLQIQGRNFNVQIDVDPDNSEGPTVVTFGDTSDSHDFIPVPASSLEFRSVPGAPKSFKVALPKSVPAFDVRIKDARGSFVGILSVKATPSVRTIVQPGSTGPFAYDIEIAFTPGRSLSGIGARMAVLTEARETALRTMAQQQGWNEQTLRNLNNWYGSQAVTDEQRAVLHRLIDQNDFSAIRAGFDAPTDYMRPGTAGTRGEMEDLAAGKIGPNYFSATTVAQYVQAFIDWYRSSGQTAPVLIAREVRDRSDEFARISMAMFTNAGIPVIYVSEPVSTPFASFLAKTSNVALAFQISASHNNFKDNGIKFMGSQGQQLLPNELGQITGRIPSLDRTREVPGSVDEQFLTVVDGAAYEQARKAYFDSILATLPASFREDVRTAAENGVQFVYTALNGVGGKETVPFLAELGLVEGTHYFTTDGEMTPLNELEPGSEADEFARARKNSDPAGPGLLDGAMRLAESRGVRVVYAHDPDRDRMVVAVRVGDAWKKLNGNQSASLMLEHRFESGVMGPDSVVMYSHATTDTIGDIASAHGTSAQKFPVGFKYPGAMVTQMGQVGTNFFAAEESYGTSPGHIAEKDGLPAMAMVMWLAATHPDQPEIIWDYLLGIYERYGVRGDVVLSTPIEGADAPTREENKGRVLASLEALTPGSAFGTFTIESVSKSVLVDFLKDEYPDGFKDGYDLTVRDAEGTRWRILLRASGTEPIFKAYVSLVDPIRTSKSEAMKTLESVESAIKRTVKPVIERAFAEMATQAPVTAPTLAVSAVSAPVAYTGTIPFEANGQTLAPIEYDLRWENGTFSVSIHERSPGIGLSGKDTETSVSDTTVSTFEQTMSGVDFDADSFRSVSRVEVIDSRTQAPRGLLVFTVERSAEGLDITAQLDPLDISDAIGAVERFSSPEFAAETQAVEQARQALSGLPDDPAYSELKANIERVIESKKNEERQALANLEAARESRARVFSKGGRVDAQVERADRAIITSRVALGMAPASQAVGPETVVPGGAAGSGATSEGGGIVFPGFEAVEQRFVEFIDQWTPRFSRGPQTPADERAKLAAFQPKPGHQYRGATPIAVEPMVTPEVYREYLEKSLKGVVPIFFMAGAAMRFSVLVANKAKGTFSANNLLELEPVFQQVVADHEQLAAEIEALGLPDEATAVLSPELEKRVKEANAVSYVSKIGDASMKFTLSSMEAGKKTLHANYVENLRIARMLRDAATTIRADIESKRQRGMTPEQVELMLNFQLSTLQFASYVYELRKQAGDLYDLTADKNDPDYAANRQSFVDRFVRENGQAIVSVNEETGHDVISDLYQNGFFGLDPERVTFTVSPTLPVLVASAENPERFTFITPEEARTRFGATETPAHPYGHGFMVPVLNLAPAAFVVSVADSKPGDIKLRQLTESAMDRAIDQGGIESFNRNVDDLTGHTSPIPRGLALKHHPDLQGYDGLVFLTFNASRQKGGGAVAEIDEFGNERTLILEGPEIAGFLEILKAPIRAELKAKQWTSLTVDQGLSENEANLKIEEQIEELPEFKSISNSLKEYLNQMLVVDFDIQSTRQRQGSIDQIYDYLRDLNIVLASKEMKGVPSSFIETFFTSVVSQQGRLRAATRIQEVEPNIALKSPVHAVKIGKFPGFVDMALTAFEDSEFASFVFQNRLAGATLVQDAAGARMAGSPVRAELEKIGGYQDPIDLTLQQAQSDPDLKQQFNEALYLLSRPNVLEKGGQEVEFPITFEYPDGRVGILSAQVRLSGGSIELRLGDDSASFGVKAIESDIAPVRNKTELDEQAQAMGVFSGSLRALMDAVETNRLEDPLHFRRKLDATSVDVGQFPAAKVNAFGAWARNMALVYRAAYKKQQNHLGEDAPGIKLHLVLSDLDEPLADAVREQLKSFADEEWLNVIDKGEVTSEMLQHNGREALLVDVKTASPAMHRLAVGAHVVGRLTNGVVPDEAAAVAASLNTVGAVELGDGSSTRERFANGRIIDDAGALGRINANYDADKKASSLDVYLGDFSLGILKHASRALKISIGRLLQTMRMMITQVAMAA